MAAELVKYDEMCRAIEAAYVVDEVKDIRDKAFAMEAYFRQAKNPEPERRACEIRLRAERRAGQLLAEMDNAKTGPKSSVPSGNITLNDSKGLEELGISRKQSMKWQQLADVPQDEFEAALAAPDKPSTSGIIINSRATPLPMNKHALWLWGRLRDFERDGVLDEHPGQVFLDMTDGMQADVRRLIPIVIAWLNEVRNDKDGN